MHDDPTDSSRPAESGSDPGEAAYVEPGKEFTRDTNYITDRITRDGRDGYPVEAGRYRLVAPAVTPGSP